MLYSKTGKFNIIIFNWSQIDEYIQWNPNPKIPEVFEWKLTTSFQNANDNTKNEY